MNIQFLPPCLRNPADVIRTDNLFNCFVGTPTSNGALYYWAGLILTLTGIVAFFYIIYAGYMMATAFGDESKYATAKKTMLYAVIGVILATLARVIVSFVQNLLTGN